MKKSVKLSLCMIVKNEEENLPRCLGSVKDLFDEIIIVDTGSTDNTKEIAKQFGAEVYDFTWINDFSAARNFSFSKSCGQYIMWLDADDELDEINLEKLKTLKKNLNGSVDVYMVKYAYGTKANQDPSFVFYRERILKNDKSFFWIDPVHEIIVPHGKVEHTDIVIFHRKNHDAKDRNLKIYEAQLKAGKKLTARQQFYYGRELKDNLRYRDSIAALNDFLLRKDAWLENKIDACLAMAQCYLKLNDLQGAMKSLFASFVFAEPRAEILCEIANILITQQQFSRAVYWLKLALKIKPNLQSGAFVNLDCYQFIPHLQLCVCYYHLGKMKLSEKENLLASKVHPTDLAVLQNLAFFKKQKQKK